MQVPFTVKEQDFKGAAYRVNKLIEKLCLNIPNQPAEAPRPGSSHAQSTDLVLFGTHADRVTLAPPASHIGAIYVETDEENTAYQSQYLSNVATWVYVSGTYQRTQAQLATLAASLGAADAGLLAEVTDYRHVLRWTGSAWEWGPGETGGGYSAFWSIAPPTGWVAYDGAAHTYLKSDGSTGSLTLENLAGTSWFPKAGEDYTKYTGSSVAAVVPTAAASALTVAAAGAGTASSPSHTHVISLPGDPVKKMVYGWYLRI